MRAIVTLLTFVTLLTSSLTGCSSAPPIAFNNVTADEHELLARNPALQWDLWQRDFPQDNHLHFSGSIGRPHDKRTGAVGFEVAASVKWAWPRILPPDCPTCWTDDHGHHHHSTFRIPSSEFVKRPRVPVKPYPPDSPLTPVPAP
jgi:hypothetical protein